MYKSLLNPSPYPPSQASRRPLIKIPVSIILLILIVLGLQFLILPNYLYRNTPAAENLSQFHLNQLAAGLEKCTDFNTPPISYALPSSSSSRKNPRWNPVSGQNETVLLKNAILFDGDTILSGLVDVEFKEGIISSVSSASNSQAEILDVKVLDVEGRYVTPGLVDLHSHHFLYSWPSLRASDDTNEVHLKSGPLTPFVRAWDSIKAYDPAAAVIASGGVTTSLLLPGSANIMGGEGILVKNLARDGEHSEPVVEDLLLEHGIPEKERRRYLKMACGENPRGVYSHTRMGNAWLFREQMTRAKELREKQDAWCLSAAAVRESNDVSAISAFMTQSLKDGGLPEELELDSTLAMLRGKIGINIHCYESEDIEDMLHHSKEFGFRIQAFHHALDAWEVPELIKDSGENITVATFSEFGFYKKEAYEANLWAGKILSDHGVPVAYKSDHVGADTNAKYLMFQAATAHAFHLPEDLALQSVTSVPARSLQIDHRVGFVRPGYDADLVVWDSHPLLAGATPFQVYIDGKATLEPIKVKENESKQGKEIGARTPVVRRVLSEKERKEICGPVENGGKVVITGITTSYLDSTSASSEGRNLTMVLSNNQITCFGSPTECLSASRGGSNINLSNGHVLPGLTAITGSLGLSEISSESSTNDGTVPQTGASLNAENVVYAKYGLRLDGKAFVRARIGGITKAVTAPLGGGFVTGVSVGFATEGKEGLLEGAVWKDDVALHFTVGQRAKGSDATKTISTEIAKLRAILTDNEGKDNIFARATNGSLPLVVHADNEYDILQLIKLKTDYPEVNLILLGGAEAPLVAAELATSRIPLILTRNRDAPDTFEKRHALPGPPLSRSPAAVLSEAGVEFGIAIVEGDSHIHNLAIEAGIAAKYAGLSKREAVDLVSRNIEKILRLNSEHGEGKEDIVIWEGDPLELGASVVLSISGKRGVVGGCWLDGR